MSNTVLFPCSMFQLVGLYQDSEAGSGQVTAEENTVITPTHGKKERQGPPRGLNPRSKALMPKPKVATTVLGSLLEGSAVR